MDKWVEWVKIMLAGGAAYLFGGFDAMMQMLCIVMLIDFFTGLLVAAVFHKSPKTKGGTLSSNAALTGLIRKICLLFLVILITRLSQTIGDSGFCRSTAIIFFTVNEALSVLENMGLMGVQYPAWLRESLEILLHKNNS